MESATQSLQERYAPESVCYGCGPANARGLRIRSFVADERADAGNRAAGSDRGAGAAGSASSGSASGGGAIGAVLVAEWTPAPHHEAFPGILNGGIIGTLLDCHCNWTAAYHLMHQAGADHPGCTVTAEYTIKLKRPTPAAGPVRLRAWVVESTADRATVEGTLEAGGQVCATCRSLFVAVKPGHPAYHRW